MLTISNLKFFTLVLFLVAASLSIPEKASAMIDSAENLSGYIIDLSEVGKAEKITFGKGRKSDPEKVFSVQQERGVIETGLTPLFGSGVTCRPIDSEKWAIDYSYKRGKPAHHKGIDIPAPRGTPVLAIADGVVVGKFLNEKNAKGIEIVLRHKPEDTGLPFWTYSQYTHLQEMPDLPIGAKIEMGSEIGKTSNTGISGREARRKNTGRKKSKKKKGKVRRNALHFAIFYTDSPKFSKSDYGVIPLDGYFMDPNAFYRKHGPYDSVSMKNLPENEKKISIPYMNEAGKFTPSDTKVIWPYSCWSK